MRLVLVGTSHHHAPVELRERVALDREHASALAARLGEAVCLSTCNRTELYVAAEDVEDAERRAVAALAELEPEVEPALYRLRDQAAALHLFRVAAGLDSLVPGEGEILGQVRAAHEAGTTGHAARPGLPPGAARRAARCARRRRSARRPASVSSAAAALAEQVFGDLDGCSILLVGAGKISEQAARNLLKRRARIAFVANRTLDHGSELAERFGAEALRSTGSRSSSPRPTSSCRRRARPATCSTLRPSRAPARRGRQLLLIDLAVPRDLDPAIHELDGCYLYDIDDLEAIVSETLAGRRGEAERAEAIVAAESEKFHEWQASLEIVPGDRVAARARRGDPRGRAAQGRGPAGPARRQPAPGGRVDHRPDREQAPAPADRAHEAGGRGSRRGDLC